MSITLHIDEIFKLLTTYNHNDKDCFEYRIVNKLELH